MASQPIRVSETLAPAPLHDDEYESDSEGASALALRRREASDDEEDDRQLHGKAPQRASSREDDRSRPPFTDEEDVDDEGAPPVDDDQEEDNDDVGRSDFRNGRRRSSRDQEEEEEEDEDDEDADDADVNRLAREDLQQDSTAKAQRGTVKAADGTGIKDIAEDGKKDAEPFVVPTAGAFYMHDDRFRDNGGARPRRSAGGRKLWEAKDEMPWVHDRFEELNLHEDSFHGQGMMHGRGGRGRFRGRGRARGLGHVKSRQGETRTFMDNSVSSSWQGSRKGRAPKRFQNDDHGAEDNSAAASKITTREMQETRATSNPSSQTAVKQPESSAIKKSGGSMLNSASPPFYPFRSLQHSLTGETAGSGNIHGAQNQLKGRDRDVQQGGKLGVTAKAAIGQGEISSNVALTTRQSLNSVNNASLVRISSPPEVDGNFQAYVKRGQNTYEEQSLRSGSGVKFQQQQLMKIDKKTQPNTEQLLGSANGQQASRVTSQAQPAAYVPLQAPQTLKNGHQSVQEPAQTSGVNQSSSLSPAVDLANAPSSSGVKMKSTGGIKSSRGSALQVGRVSSVYNVANAGGLTSGLRSVVQFSGQPQTGLGVPTVGMALPGYPNQPQFGFSNSEVTWVPILAGGGALGAGYSSPYVGVEGASSPVYYTPATAQPASFTLAGKELNGAKPLGSLIKPPLRQDFGNEEFGQRQSKPRRYSEMNFGQ